MSNNNMPIDTNKSSNNSSTNHSNIHNNTTDTPTSSSSSSITDPAITHFAHQVAGHRNEIIRKYQNNKIIKPCIKLHYFQREVNFYENIFNSNDCISHSILRRYLPKYHGLLTLENAATTTDTTSNTSTNTNTIPYTEPKQYIILDDLTIGYIDPCILDIKIGLKTYEPSSSQTKINSQLNKFKYQAILGFRLSGMKVYNILTNTYTYYDKSYGRAVTPESVNSSVATYFYNGHILRKDIIIQIIQKLEIFKNYLSLQTLYHYYTCSLLLIYEGQTGDSDETDFYAKGHNSVGVHLIDFAHVCDGNGVVDANFVQGLEKFLTVLYELL